MQISRVPDVECRLAEASDLATIGDFLPELGGSYFHERFPGKTAGEFYRWKYFGNPLGKAAVGIAVAGDRVVSIISAIPKPLRIRGTRLLAYELGDFLTAPNFRRRGLFSELVKLVLKETQSRGAALLYVRPNDMSFPILAKLGFKEPRQIHQRMYPRPAPLLARKLHIPEKLSSGLGIDTAGYRLVAPPAGERNLEVTPVSRFGPEIDALWEQCGSQYTFLLARQCEYLNWRYADCPTPFQIWMARRNGRAAGYLVGFVGQEERLAMIADVFAPPGDLSAARALMHHAFREYHRAGVLGIYSWTLARPPESAASRCLRRACPFVRQPVLHMATYSFDESETLQFPDSGWHISMGDFDGV